MAGRSRRLTRSCPDRGSPVLPCTRGAAWGAGGGFACRAGVGNFPDAGRDPAANPAPAVADVPWPPCQPPVTSPSVVFRPTPAARRIPRIIGVVRNPWRRRTVAAAGGVPLCPSSSWARMGGVSDRDRLGRSAVHYAVVDGDVDRLKALLTAGADPELADADGWRPLHFAAQAHDAVAIEVLVAAGAACDPVDRHGNTPLWRAVFASRGEGAAIRALVNAGADPDRVNGHGVSPRMLAARIANYDVAAFLPGERGPAS